MRRLHQHFQQQSTDTSSTHWRMLKEAVKDATGLAPFDQVDQVTAKGFRYLQSIETSNRFEILQGDEPYTARTEWIPRAAEHLPPGAGPVEIEIATLITDPRSLLALVVGGMGCGKSTTLRQMVIWLNTVTRVQYLNCDKTVHDQHNVPSALELLVAFLHPFLMNLMTPEEEFGVCWDWALANYGSPDLDDRHSAIAVFKPVVDEIRSRCGRDATDADPHSPAFRMKTLRPLLKTSINSDVLYFAFLIDYYLSVRCNDNRHALCIVLDNVDHLPPRLQRELLSCCLALQMNARCKIVVSMRPLTYSLTHEQRATRTVHVVQHIGPPAIDLIADRCQRLIQHVDCPRLKHRVVTDNGMERELGQEDFKAWAAQVLKDIQMSRVAGHGHQEPSALDFIEGICNYSLRSALIVAEKIFGSPNFRMVLPDEQDGVQASALKNHEIIRATLLSRNPYFVSTANRVIDNLFDFGEVATCSSVTCKYRLLKELATTPGRGILGLGELVIRLRPFGYDDAVILGAINGVIDQYKRLAWSDTETRYDSLDGSLRSRLCISRAGRFYVERAIHSLEYVQEVHVDVLLPDEAWVRAHNHASISERFESRYLFVRYVIHVDKAEVLRAKTDPEASLRYVQTYKDVLFSATMAESVGRQVLSIGDSVLRRRRIDDRFRLSMETALAPWRSLGNLLLVDNQSVQQR